MDSNFAMAYAALGTAYSNVNRSDQAIDIYHKALALLDHVTDHERYYIEAGYYDNVLGNLEMANLTYTRWIKAFPGDDTPHLNLGFNYASRGQFEKAAFENKEDLRINQNDVVGYGNLMNCYLALGQWDKADAEFRRAQARKLDGPDLRIPRYYLAFLQSDSAGMQEQLAWAEDKPKEQEALFSAQSDTEAYYGRLARARDFSQRAATAAKRHDSKETESIWRLNAALREVEFGNPAASRTVALDCSPLTSGRNVQLLGALLLARAGDAADTKRVVDRLNQEFPNDTMVQSYWLPAIRGALELKQGNIQAAIESLRAASDYELGSPAEYLVGTMYPIYIRGQGYLQKREGQQAAAEFRKFLDHRGVIRNFPLGALAYLQLARALAMSGNNAGAGQHYQDFLKLWKDADADIPVFEQARREYAELRTRDSQAAGATPQH